MTRSHIWRVLLASLFLVFNVGLPVLVDSCPMPKPVGSMMCPLCHENESGVRGEILKGKPCCTPSIAAERNTNEFLGVQKHIAAPAPVLCVVPAPCVAAPCATPAVVIAPAAHPPFAPDDIPVLHSSLLI